MLPTDTYGETEQDAQPRPHGRRRLVAILAILAVILLLTFIPPLISVSRFQRQVDRDISAALGRPVHFDRVSLTIMPLPGFTLDNFVVDEDPAFGSEPTLRADQVHVTLRISSLWRRRVEFSRISLVTVNQPPDVNLVRLSDGRWNIENLLLQASRSEAAPTAQRYAGPAPRFPYIEASGARVNLKLNQVKTPFSLTDADFALWLPEPHQWHLRLEANLLRTDTSPGDTGTIRMEGTLGSPGTRADSLAEVPIDLHGDWRDLQLGGLGILLLGRDTGLRGDLSLSFTVQGTVGLSTIATQFQLAKARRADFLPDHLLSLNAACNAIAQNTFQTFSSIECHWPPADSSDPSVLIVTGDLPEVSRPSSATATITLPALPSATLVDWLSVATPHPPTGLAGTGILAGTLTWRGSDSPLPDASAANAQSHPHQRSAALQPAPTVSQWSGDLEFSGESIDLPALGPKPVPIGDILLRSAPESAPPAAHASSTSALTQQSVDAGFDLSPIALPLGGKQPMTLEGHFDDSGYTLHLSGSAIPARLLALGNAIPQLGDGLAKVLQPNAGATPSPSPEATISARGHGRTSPKPASPEPSAVEETPIHVDLTASRIWGGPQIWHEAAQPPPSPHRRTGTRIGTRIGN